MCGIAGFVMQARRVPDGALARRMTDAIAHRGPDDEGFFESVTRDGQYRIALGHRRLSIIDLASGHQPMCNEDGSVQIVFNGEIYNFQSLREELIRCGHRFATHSDTETIVHAYEEYGEACVDRFRGMFAFALWDAGRERLFLARDRFGKKPLFLARRGDALLFASEIKALLAYPGIDVEVDRQAVWDYLAYRYTPGPATLFSGIEKLAPGSYAIWSKGSLTQSRYYLPPDRRTYPGAVPPKDPPEDPIGAFLASLDEAVRIRMVSDVPFGAYLSGGVDSSAVVGLMTRHSGLPVKTFSVGFAQHGYSELDHARIVSQQFGTEHHELVVSERDLMDALPALVRFRDAPVSEPSDIPIFLLSKEARRSVKMVLTGEGSDEFLGGYPKHVYERYVGRYQALPRMLREGVLAPLVMSLPYRFRRAKTAIVNMNLADATDRFPRWFGALSPRERDALIAFRPPNGAHAGEQFATDTANSALRRILYFDQMSWLPDNLLERGDRMTMAASIEARMPFMDQELAAFVSSLPDRYRVRGFKTKWILRQAMTRLLPARILERPKVGFRVPVNEWFRGPMRDFLYDHLAGPDSRTRGYYREAALRQLMAEHVNGRQNSKSSCGACLTWSCGTASTVPGHDGARLEVASPARHER